MKLVAIVGSPRLKGNTNYLVDQALGEASRLGAETEKLILGQYQINPCLGHDNCSSFDSCQQKDDATWILDKMCQADGVILATPVYYYNVSAQMKVFIDRNYYLYKHNRKSQARVVGIIIVAGSEGIEDTLHTLKQFIAESFNVDDDKILIVSGFATKPGDAKNNPELIEEATRLGRQVVEILQ